MDEGVGSNTDHSVANSELLAIRRRQTEGQRHLKSVSLKCGGVPVSPVGIGGHSGPARRASFLQLNIHGFVVIAAGIDSYKPSAATFKYMELYIARLRAILIVCKGASKKYSK